MKSISDILKTLFARIKKILWNLGLHAFSIILLFIFIDFIFGGVIFYKYVFSAEKEEPKVTENILKFDEKTYLEVLGELQARGQGNVGAQAATNTQTTVVAPATNQTTYILPRYLGYGDKGDDVLMLQKLLVQLGFLSEIPNGNYGLATKTAVQKFQQAHSIKQTGDVGPATKDALNQVFISTPITTGQ